MNVADLLAELEQDIYWRTRELDALFRSIGPGDEPEMLALRRATVPMIQAHSEGFVKFALQAYLRFINSSQIIGQDIKSVHLSWALKHEFGHLHDGSVDAAFKSLAISDIKAVRAHFARDMFLQRLEQLQSQCVVLDESRLDRFEKNLDESHLMALLYQCGLEVTAHRSYSRKLNGLVIRRNNVAHGENAGADLGELEHWRDVVLELFRAMRDAVYNAARSRAYLKDAASTSVGVSP